MLKILEIHNSHRSGSASGDDIVFRKESDLLQQHGHKVQSYEICNDEFDRKTIIGKFADAMQIPWSFATGKHIRNTIRREKPDVAHVHNCFPLISPSVYHVLSTEGIPIVQTLHDFRFLCPMAFLMRNGAVCEDCNKSLLKSVRHGCFKKSTVQTIPVATMLRLHKSLGTFQKKIDVYVCLTKTQLRVFSASGFDTNKLIIKPNFVEDTYGGQTDGIGKYAVFIGRLSEEKGLRTLITAWKSLPDVPLKIIGDGPDSGEYIAIVNDLGIKNIEFTGLKPHAECMNILDGARFLIMPSVWYETFGLVIVEAFCHEKPVIASRLGAMQDIVKDEVNGLLFEPGNPTDLAQKVRRLWSDSHTALKMGRTAREEYEKAYTPEINYELLMDIYKRAMQKGLPNKCLSP